MKCKALLIFCVTCLCLQHLPGQVIESNGNRERVFAFEVKQIDEFFERFNNEDKSLITSYIRLKYPNIIVTRESLVNSLFDQKQPTWKTNEVIDFSTEVTDSIKPAYLNFYNNDWFAEALCKFKYKGKAIDVVILLQIQQENGGSKWMIKSAYSRLITPSKAAIMLPVNNKSRKFLNPMSHATNFISLSRALGDKPHIPDYLDSNFLQYPSSKGFLGALLNNQLDYQFVREIKYHFLQVDGWIFTVNRFNRQSVNSGWLISKLSRATDVDKDAYRTNLFRKSGK